MRTSLKLIKAGTFMVFSMTVAQSYAKGEEAFTCGPTVPEASKKIETLIPKLYDIVSGYPSDQKDWDLMKSFFLPNAIITPVFHQSGKMTATPGSVDDFIALNKVYFKDVGFFENETAQKRYIFGNMANVLSAYESRRTPHGKPYANGVNSFQLLNDGRRWCVLSVTWDSESKTRPFTEEQRRLKEQHAL